MSDHIVQDTVSYGHCLFQTVFLQALKEVDLDTGEINEPLPKATADIVDRNKRNEHQFWMAAYIVRRNAIRFYFNGPLVVLFPILLNSHPNIYLQSNCPYLFDISIERKSTTA